MMNQIKTIPGLQLVGVVRHPQVCGGAPIPMYESTAPADGRPDISTVEGWNALAEKYNPHRSSASPLGA